MIRSAAAILCLLAALLTRSATSQEIIAPDEAKKDADFLVQGEFTGQGVWPGDEKAGPIGAQVIAQGGRKFRAVLYRGGLPGAGWKRGDARLFMDGPLAGGAVKLSGKDLPAGHIRGDVLTLGEGKSSLRLKRTTRSSPILGARAPAGAVVLFDGTSADHFSKGKLTDMKTLQAGCTTKKKHQIAKLHLEFRLSWKPKARGQGRSNSGVYITGIPEIQVLDSFGLEGAKNECGAFYGRRVPDVNMCLPPLVWQTFDVEFSDGEKAGEILVTVRHNGVIVHKDYKSLGKDFPPRSIHLQAHGNRVQYRNIWIVGAEEK